ncbi:hypothetical protein Tco_0165841, partial [Tanacetum coccineum]
MHDNIVPKPHLALELGKSISLTEAEEEAFAREVHATHARIVKARKGKPTFQLVDEDDEAQQESVPQEEGDDPDLELAKKMSLEAHQKKGEGEGDDADMKRAIKLSLDPAFLPQ